MIKSREEIKNELLDETMSCDKEEAIRYLKSVYNGFTIDPDSDEYVDPEEEMRSEVALELLKSLK